MQCPLRVRVLFEKIVTKCWNVVQLYQFFFGRVMLYKSKIAVYREASISSSQRAVHFTDARRDCKFLNVLHTCVLIICCAQSDIQFLQCDYISASQYARSCDVCLINVLLRVFYWNGICYNHFKDNLSNKAFMPRKREAIFFVGKLTRQKRTCFGQFLRNFSVFLDMLNLSITCFALLSISSVIRNKLGGFTVLRWGTQRIFIFKNIFYSGADHKRGRPNADWSVPSTMIDQ